MKKIFFVFAISVLVWSCAHKTTPSKTETVTSSDAVAGKATYTAKCGQCHGLKDPANFTATQWVPILDNMARKANLDATEKANVLAYVLANAKKG
ncbi:MAG: cytochrome c [Ferruginibacter sp.]